ncbi:MAG: hypothetical protein V4730_12075 [Pseudomonadota bacterium]
MADFVKYEPFIQGLCDKLFDLFGTTDTLKVAIATSADTPVVATDDEMADVSQITGTGYTALGGDTQNDATRTGGTVTLTGVDFVWTATSTDWTAGRYIVLHDDTSTTDRLIAYWDYGSAFTVSNGETFTVNFGASIATFA